MKPTSRVDERDTMFARMARIPGTPCHEDYYGRRPELLDVDDRIRRLPPLLARGARFHDADLALDADRYFREIDEIAPDPSVVQGWRQRLEAASRPTEVLKALTLELGAVGVGCTILEPAYAYSHKGRLDEDYGQPVTLEHQDVLVFLVEMDHEAMQSAPRAPTIVESARQYFRAAKVSMTVEAVLRAAGHGAKAHYDAHYDVILPPLAVNAGLGELGRNNILVADRYGSRVRIGAVSCDLPLEHDAPIDLGVDHFCRICKKCADNCPSRSLTCDDKQEVRGVMKWPTDVERCYTYWRTVGTDCGVCMACCPFSHRDNWFHRCVRWVVRVAPWSHRLALWCDDLVYGRRWERKQERRDA
jgi:reductive dehalogenase